MSLRSAVIRAACPLPKIESFNRFLFVGPHPDDIEIGCGATIAKLTSMGKGVSFLICTDGRFGTTNLKEKIEPAELAKIRVRESINSANALGVKDVRFLGLSDGGLYNYEDLFLGIAKTVADVGPEIIFAPDPSVISECHTDHLNVGNAVKKLAFLAPFEGIMNTYGCKPANVQAVAFYYTTKINSYVNTCGFLEKQLNSIFKCHVSQFPPDCKDITSISTYLKLRSVLNGLHIFSSAAEGFRVLGSQHMHCLPEVEEWH